MAERPLGRPKAGSEGDGGEEGGATAFFATSIPKFDMLYSGENVIFMPKSALHFTGISKLSSPS
jgi:hypothetical protein